MKAELDARLCEKYPKIFANRHGDIRTTCMAWGFECGSGWYWLIDNLCGCIQKYIDNNRKDQFVAEQVKEKYGGLRFDGDYANDLIDGMIWFAEYLSFRICEECGSHEGKLFKHNDWMYTRCDKCRDKIVNGSAIGGREE